jgi:Uma2 family endonuclease
MPGGPISKRRPLLASIYLFNIDSIPVSEDIEISRLFVINDQLIWVSTPGKGVQPNVPAFKQEKLNKNGPEWETNIFVDVVVEIISKSSSAKYYLITRNQRIEKLD